MMPAFWALSQNSEAMRLTVFYFSTLRDRSGLRQEEVTLPEEASVADLMTLLRERHAGLEAALPSTLVSVNREYAFPDDTLQDGDEVALFPPVSGGSESPAGSKLGPEVTSQAVGGGDRLIRSDQ